MKRYVWMPVLALVLFASVLAAADISGKWSGEVPRRGGETSTATFVFKVEGDKVTGTMSGQQGEVALQDVTLKGDELSFSTTGGNAKIVFKGTVSGDQIRMTRAREGGQAREFTLKRMP
jgi:hypothetical protein